MVNGGLNYVGNFMDFQKILAPSLFTFSLEVIENLTQVCKKLSQNIYDEFQYLQYLLVISLQRFQTSFGVKKLHV